MKTLKLTTLAALATLSSAVATPLKWTCDWPEARAQAFSLYQGETATFEPTFRVNGQAVTNAAIEAVWYQTNGMANAWWKLDGATFAPSNDCGAAAYRFFVEARVNVANMEVSNTNSNCQLETGNIGTGDTSTLATLPILYRANGTLRMLPSPGFTPNAVPLPVKTLDFAAIDYSNAPWLLPDATNDFAAVEGRLSSAENSIAANAAEISTNAANIASNAAAVASLESGKVSRSGDTMTGNLIVAQDENHQASYTQSGISKKIGRTIYSYTFPGKNGTFAMTSDIPSSYAWSSITSKPNTISGYGITDAKIKNSTITIGSNSITPLTSYTETDPTIYSWAKQPSKPSYTAGEVGAAERQHGHAACAITNFQAEVESLTAPLVYRLVSGTNAVFVITNYNSAVHCPSVRFEQLGTNGTWMTYYDSKREHAETLTNAMDYADGVAATRAPAAWSRTTSGLGQEAPSGTTWLSTPKTVIAGGFEYEKTVTSSGAVWILTANGLGIAPNTLTNGFFSIATAGGEPIISVERTDARLVGVDPDGISRSGDTVTISLPLAADAHPYVRASTNLVNAAWVKEDENGFSCPFASVSWGGTSGGYVATVTCSAPEAFFFFECLQPGETKIVNNGVTDLTGGIIFNGMKYYPTSNGNKLEFVAQ